MVVVIEARGRTAAETAVTTEAKIPIERVSVDDGQGCEIADARMQARMRLISFAFPTYIALCIGFGWCLEAKVNIAGPLVFLFFSA